MAPRGRGKFSKPSRGGGKHFSRDVQPVDKHGNPVGLWREPDDDATSSSQDDKEEEEEEEEEEDVSESGGESSKEDTKPGTSSSATPEMTREERRAAVKAKKQAAIAKRNLVQPGDLPPSDSESENGRSSDGDEDLPSNPNHTTKSRSQLKDSNPEQDMSQLSRREREAIEAQQERERYLKLHAEGKTEEARADLARLAIIRERREAERLRKEAEKEEKAELAKRRAAEIEAKLNAKKKGGSKKKK
ncbi:casein kinase substrate phospho protein PP28-domain-containing protein [Aspergillus bertholletiae]|uniref:Casein kinase substrate phospho protein PP28-domain-containing protein n=1 Tax=Aspergillus bertholletiae TaxID=1226010 RepID=A0A5N7B2D6_9EURO|nr:casein kinase substrate phospho protein PP28-domain-containing protein [Aspergillus bertholletiae]